MVNVGVYMEVYMGVGIGVRIGADIGVNVDFYQNTSSTEGGGARIGARGCGAAMEPL